MTARNQSVELLRIAACLGIVAFHEKAPGWAVCYAGLTVFLILTAYFEATARRPTGVQARARQLLWPWVIATVAYGALNVLRHKPILPERNVLLGLAYGTSPHLWFLPFAFIALLVIGYLKRWPLVLLWAGLGLLALMLWLVTAYGGQVLTPPAGQYLQAAAPICLGVVLAFCALRPKAAWLAGGVVAAVALAVGVPHQGIAYGLGLASVVVALLYPTPWDVTPISRHMYGVYLVHPAALSVVHLAHLKGWPAAIAAFVLSLIAVLAAWFIATKLGRTDATRASPGRVGHAAEQNDEQATAPAPGS